MMTGKQESDHGEHIGREERASGSVAMGTGAEMAMRRRCKKTGLVRTPKGSGPLRGTHKVEGGTGKNVIGILYFGILVAMGWHVVWNCDVGPVQEIEKKIEGGSEDSAVEGTHTEKGRGSAERQDVPTSSRGKEQRNGGRYHWCGGLAGSAGPSWQ